MNTVREIRCSTLSRFIKCRGLAQFTDLPVYETGDAAKEGTAFGEYMTDRIERKQPRTFASNDVVIDRDMVRFGEPIIEDIFERAGGNQVTSEVRIDFTTPSGITIRGQYDVQFINGRTLHIEDFKYGYKIVEVEENWQLMGYAIGFIIKTGFIPERIEFRIHQPRVYHEDGTSRVWSISYEQLIGYYNQIVEMTNAIAQGDRTLVAGRNCYYCTANTQCPAATRQIGEIAEYVHSEDWNQSEGMTNDELAQQFDFIERLAEIIKIRKDSLENVIKLRLKEGKIVGNLNIVEKIGNREWKKGITAEMVSQAVKTYLGFDVDLTESAMVSPAEAERRKVPKSLVNSLVFRPVTGSNLKRVNISKTADEVFGKE